MPTNCENCGIGFAVEREEMDWLRTEGKEIPSLCPRCRAFKDGLQDESISCNVCGKVFIFPRELRWFAKMFGWPRPRRCIGGCKTNATAMGEVELQMADFLRRLRFGRKLGTMGPVGLHTTETGMKRSSPATPDASKSDGAGDSLARALREFQERKRRRS